MTNPHDSQALRPHPTNAAAATPLPDAAGAEGQRTEQAVARLIASNRQRRKVRKWIALGTLPLTIIGLLFVVKVLSMFIFAHFSISAYASGDGEGAAQAAAGQTPVNWFEPYKAPFNQGDGYAIAARLPDARERFEAALEQATGFEVCTVSINLSLVIEAQGDAEARAGDQNAAQKFFVEALAVTADMPEECKSAEASAQSTDPNRDMSEEIDENQQRQQEKAQQKQEEKPSDPQDGEEPQPSPSPSDDPNEGQPSEDKLGELQKKLEQGQEERDARESDTGDPGGGGAEKPW